ncbi:3-oxoacyl-[acyl-carrier protein] reductase [Amycolatopsis bartoniae]|uniref:Short-chain dehydrogenase n=1 Tax=Amycolatopsis bartoniae TaxID=941986 RepID=A0A8H9IQH6_9PSEU|nr:SDR family oxidoreductase [Amycolatopsis bartoniae]MBB2939334.1 3-oxoacyl-[acyl-carrier protein] reductase [Amycolatopsis bartoniae]TVS99402.1 SDR family oxidoreductase [Amycolatopsis bartoniae]GHF37216.1 short-chain dehydrogenase [Amycolatopsis bartoniae]
MDLGLTGKVAIVGGGSDGLGFAIAERLLAEGAHVAFFARRAEKVAAAERQLAERYGEERVLGLTADCSSAADLEGVTASTLERFGDAVHVLVTNDGGPPIRRISELTDEVWLQAFERHFFYVVRSVRATLPHMTAEGGSILNVVSAVARRPAVGMAAPTTVWSAVIGYAQTLALEVGAQNISVNTLLAGYFDTPLLAKTIERQPELSKERLGSTAPLGRIGAPREFADLVATLVSPGSRFVTGTVTPVDGGASVGMGASFDSAAPAPEGTRS